MIQQKRPSAKFRKVSFAVFFVGLLAGAAGAGFLAYRLTRPSTVSDAEFLVSVGTWQRTDVPSVIWQFTDLGHGLLTTNSGDNEYAFTWSLTDGQLKIDTAWLYTLNDAYAYSLDQSASTLTLTLTAANSDTASAHATSLTFAPAP